MKRDWAEQACYVIALSQFTSQSGIKTCFMKVHNDCQSFLAQMQVKFSLWWVANRLWRRRKVFLEMWKLVFLTETPTSMILSILVWILALKLAVWIFPSINIIFLKIFILKYFLWHKIKSADFWHSSYHESWAVIGAFMEKLQVGRQPCI